MTCAVLIKRCAFVLTAWLVPLASVRGQPIVDITTITFPHPFDDYDPIKENDGLDDGRSLNFFLNNTASGAPQAQPGTIYEFPAGTYDIAGASPIPSPLATHPGWNGTIYLKKNGLTLRGKGGKARFVWKGFDPLIHNVTQTPKIHFPETFPPGPTFGFFRIEDCSDVTIDDFEIRMSRKPYTLADIDAIDDQRR